VTTWFRYPTRAIRNAAVPAVVAITAPVIPVVVVRFLLFALGMPAPELDSGRVSTGLFCFIGLGWVFLMIANVPRAYAYLQQFSLQEKGIARRIFRRETILVWEDLTAVEKRTRPTFENYRWIDETLLVARATGKSFAIYDRLEGFSEFKAAVSSMCRQLSIPQFSIDRTPAALSRLRRENPALYRESRRAGVRVGVEHL